LISLDTTRADHLGCYGSERVRTPALDRLAAQGVRFADVTAPAPTTLASHTSMMTGTYPPTHGVARNGFVVNAENTMLAEVLRDAGFHTAAFLGSFALERRFDFHQGFAHFDEDFDILAYTGEGSPDQDQRRADRVTDAVLAHLDELGESAQEEQLFLFAHYFDAHAPYAPPAPFDRMYSQGGEPRTSTNEDLLEAAEAHHQAVLGEPFGLRRAVGQGLKRELLDAPPTGPLSKSELLAELYAGEMSFQDAEIARLLDGLAARGLLDETLVVVTADHGETFWEHGDFWNHGLWLFQTTLHVPLIFKLPGDEHSGTVIDTPVSLIDLVPTICGLLEVAPPDVVEGHDLAPLWRGEPLERGPVFSEATQPWSVESRRSAWCNAAKPHCVRDGDWKYIRAPYIGGYEQLFHLGEDPQETRNLLRGEPSDDIRRVRDRLSARIKDWILGSDPLPSSFTDVQIEDTRRRLEGLGYTGGEEGD